MSGMLDHEPNLYMRVVAVDAERAKRFVGTDIEPVDLGPPSDMTGYSPLARVWGFAARPETARQRAKRIWAVSQGLEYNEYDVGGDK